MVKLMININILDSDIYKVSNLKRMLETNQHNEDCDALRESMIFKIAIVLERKSQKIDKMER